MNRRELKVRLLRLLGPDGMDEAEIDLAGLESGGRMPEWLERLAEAATALPLPEVPAVVSQDLHRMFDVRTFVESQRAVLVRDGRHHRELAGVRGGDASDGWSMTYTSAMADVVLDVWPQCDGSRDIVGHVMAHRAAESAYRAQLNGPTPANVAGDRLGRFRVDCLEAGHYTMVIGNGEIELTLDADLTEVEE